MALMQLRGTSGGITGIAFDVSYDVAMAAHDEIVPAIKACVDIPKRVVARSNAKKFLQSDKTTPPHLSSNSGPVSQN